MRHHWNWDMSIADHFDPRRDAGFVRDYGLQTARRQFRVSLYLIIIMAGAATVICLLTRLDPPKRQPMALHDGGQRIAETLLDIRN
jgi:hypothetical protein